MKKNLLNNMLIMLIAVGGVSFLSCGDDDDPIVVPNTPINDNSSDGGKTNFSNDSQNDPNYIVQTGEITEVTDIYAILNGNFSATQGQPNAIGFLIGTSANLTNTNRERDLSIFDIVSPFSILVEGLKPQTTYYYRAYAYNKDNKNYYYGDVKSFTTISGGVNDYFAKGNGTLSNPYNVAAISAVANRLGAGDIDASDYYIKGRISIITEDFSFNNDSTATFYISDEGTTSEKFFCKGVKYLHNEGYWGGIDIAIGDEVIICGKVTKDRNNVLGTSSGRAYMYSLNGDTGTTHAFDYYIGDRKFQTVLVEDCPMKPFYIMQTEIPVNADITIGDRIVTPLDINGDNVIIKTEFRNYLLSIRKYTNTRLRLPTKEEWEFAARGGNKSKIYIYSGSNIADDVAWHSGNSNKQRHEVALKQPNELGLYDMSGNYAEVCAEGFDECNIDGIQCGGSWQDDVSACTVTSWQYGSTKGKIPQKNTSEKNAFNADYITVRLVYTKW